MKIIALYNIKGGVGKTAAAVNLSYLSAMEGNPTLLWDLDPQGAASFYYRIKPKLKGGARKLVEKRSELEPYLKATDYALLDLVPADFSLRNFDLLLSENKKPSKRLRKLISSLGDGYEHVFLDCPPSISLVSECVFQVADALVVPTIPTTLSLRTLEQLGNYFDDNGLPLDTIMPFFSMVDSRRSMHQSITQNPANQTPFFDTFIPYNSEIEKMGVDRKPSCVKANSRMSLAYLALWKEIKNRLTCQNSVKHGS